MGKQRGSLDSRLVSPLAICPGKQRNEVGSVRVFSAFAQNAEQSDVRAEVKRALRGGLAPKCVRLLRS